MRYFDHDTTARKDDRILALRMEMGGAAVDAYWSIVEAMCEEQRPFPSDCDDYQYKVMASQLFIDTDTLCSYVEQMVKLCLFVLCEEGIVSERAKKNWEAYEAKKDASRRGGLKSAAKRKSSGLEVDSKGTCDSLPSKEKEKEKEGITNKGNTPPMADGGAEADKSAPCCQKCGAEMRLDARLTKTTRWWCSTCDSMEVIPNV